MSHPLTLKITSKVGIHADFPRKRVVISCETEDGKSICLEADYQTIEKIHEEIRKLEDH